MVRIRFFILLMLLALGALLGLSQLAQAYEAAQSDPDQPQNILHTCQGLGELPVWGNSHGKLSSSTVGDIDPDSGATHNEIPKQSGP